jgi:hypothetical protein
MRIATLITIMMLTIQRSAYCTPDINPGRYIEGEEIVGTWSLIPHALDLTKRNGYSAAEGTPQDINLWVNGNCHFSSVIRADGKIEYLDASGSWRLSHDTDYSNPSKSKNEIRIRLPDRNIVFYLKEEDGRLLLWNFWGDPSRVELLEYEKLGSRPISFITNEKQRVIFQVGTPPAVFYIQVLCGPTPKASIRIEPSAMSSPKKPWDRLLQEQMEKPLTPAHIRLLEDLLVRIRSQSVSREVWPPYPEDARRTSSLPYYQFDVERFILRTTAVASAKQQSLQWEEFRTERYYLQHPDSQAELAFLRAFVGFQP